MIPVALLIEEHNKIEKVVAVLEVMCNHLDNISLSFLNNLIAFFRIYADKSHHGKEENILFYKLKSKPLKQNEKTLLFELIEEHKKSRELITKLDSIKTHNSSEILEIFKKIITLYSAHIDKENRRFFRPAFSYFSKEESLEILKEFQKTNDQMKKEIDQVLKNFQEEINKIKELKPFTLL